jgi:hypothetical protein
MFCIQFTLEKSTIVAIKPLGELNAKDWVPCDILGDQ